MEKIKDGTLVIVGGKLGTVQRAERRAGADGYLITEGGAYGRFASEWQVRPARIGDNVCAEPYGSHWCGLIHLRPADLERVRAQGWKAAADEAWTRGYGAPAHDPNVTA